MMTFFDLGNGSVKKIEIKSVKKFPLFERVKNIDSSAAFYIARVLGILGFKFGF